MNAFRMPAEWEPHKATWLTWPHDESHWPGNFGPIPAIFARMVKELQDGEEVHIAIHDGKTQSAAENELKKIGALSGPYAKNVFFHHIPNNFAWARDHGPIFVQNREGKMHLTNWKFNAWGGVWKDKFAYDLDDRVPPEIGKIVKMPVVTLEMVLEGGSIDVNGKGTLMTTSSCLLNPNRNPGLSKADIEKNLKDLLGVRHIIWLDHEIAGDDTSGHVDDMSRFIGEKTVFTVVEENPEDQNFKALNENRKALEKAVDQDGKKLEVISVLLPKPVFFKGERLPASYANFYIGNSVVLLPVFDDPNDAFAIETLQKAFPGRRIAAIPARELVWGFGAFHCLTQQQPL